MILHYFTIEWKEESGQEIIIRYHLADGDVLHVHTRPKRRIPQIVIEEERDADSYRA